MRTLADAWGLDSSVGNVEFEVAYGSLLTSMYDDLLFQPTPPWSLPGIPIDPDNQIAFFNIFEFDDLVNRNEIFSAYSTINVAAVPLPATTCLFGIGLCALAWFRRNMA